MCKILGIFGFAEGVVLVFGLAALFGHQSLAGQLINGYTPPGSKEGASDQYYDPSLPNIDEVMTRRYSKQRNMGLGFKQYNVWWSTYESAPANPVPNPAVNAGNLPYTIPSSLNPMSCPAGYAQYPATAAQKQTYGFHRYRCLNQELMSNLAEHFLNPDAEYGLESVAVIWSAPAIYEMPGCLGGPAGTVSGTTGHVVGWMMDGCVPGVNSKLGYDTMDDFEDFIRVLSLFNTPQYNPALKGTLGKISHYIIWNENASGTWFDFSAVTNPKAAVKFNEMIATPDGAQAFTNLLATGKLPTIGVPNFTALNSVASPLGTSDANAKMVKAWLDKYADMITRAASAVSAQSGAMVYASIDGVWLPPKNGIMPNIPSGRTHLGEKTLVDGLWSRLGTKVNWSLAVHPYGDPDLPIAGETFTTNPKTSGFFNFGNLSMVAAYQASQLTKLPHPANSYPQDYLIASEQVVFDMSNTDPNYHAKKLCEVHSIAMGMPTLIGVDHNYFAALVPADNYFTPISTLAGVDFSHLDFTEGGQAYESMNPNVWGTTNNNYCCSHFNYGCAPSQPAPPTSSGPLASWAPQRVDVFYQTVSTADGPLIGHQYWDGTAEAYWPQTTPPATEPASYLGGWPYESGLGGVGSAPSALSRATNQFDVFYLVPGGTLGHQYQVAPGHWAAEPLFGGLAAGPAAISWHSEKIDVFYAVPGGALGHQWCTGACIGIGNWQWETVPGPSDVAPLTPSVVSWAPGRLDVFYKSASGNLGYRYYDSLGWHAPTLPHSPVDGFVDSAPSAVSWGPNRLDVFFRSPGGQMGHEWLTGGIWAAEILPFGGVTTAPSAVSWGVSGLDVFYGSGGSSLILGHQWWDGSEWNVEAMDGALQGAPVALATRLNMLDVFYAVPGGILGHQALSGTSLPPQGLGGGVGRLTP